MSAARLAARPLGVSLGADAQLLELAFQLLAAQPFGFLALRRHTSDPAAELVEPHFDGARVDLVARLGHEGEAREVVAADERLRRLGVPLDAEAALRLAEHQQPLRLLREEEDDALSRLKTPFGPFLALGALEFLFFGEFLVERYLAFFFG